MQVVQYGIMEQHRVLKAKENTYQMLHNDWEMFWGFKQHSFLIALPSIS